MSEALILTKNRRIFIERQGKAVNIDLYSSMQNLNRDRENMEQLLKQLSGGGNRLF